MTAGAGILFGALQGERQLRDRGPCMEAIWLLASPDVVLGFDRNREAKHCYCCARFNEKSGLLKINVLHMQHEFRRVKLVPLITARSKQIAMREYSACLYVPQ